MVAELGIAAVWFAQLLWRMEVHDTFEIVAADHEWEAETGLGRAAVQRARAKVVERGWVTCRVRKVNGTPTTHIALDVDALEGHLRAMHCSISSNPGSRDSEQSFLSDPEVDPGSASHSSDRAETPSRLIDVEPITRSPDRFDEFWRAYPKHRGRKESHAQWVRAIKDTDPQTIIDGAARYAIEKPPGSPYTLDPVRWLRGERWNDEPEPRARASGSTSQRSSTNLDRWYREQKERERQQQQLDEGTTR